MSESHSSSSSSSEEEVVVKTEEKKEEVKREESLSALSPDTSAVVAPTSENVDGSLPKEEEDVVWEGELRLKGRLLWDKSYVKMGKNSIEIFNTKKDSQTKSPKHLIPFVDAKTVELLPKRVVVTPKSGSAYHFKAPKKADANVLSTFGKLLDEGVAQIAELTKEVDVKNINDAQREQIAELKKLLNPTYAANYPQLVTDVNLLCMLKFKNFNVQQAADMWNHSISYRETHKFELAKMKNVWHYYLHDWTVAIPKHDNAGRPIRYTKLVRTPRDFNKWVETFIYTTDRILEYADEAKTVSYAHIMDYEGFNMKEHHIPEHLKAITTILTHVYPHRTPIIFMINAPWFIRVAYKAFRPFLREENVANTYIFGSDLTALYDIIPQSSLPTFIPGGTFEYDHEAYKKDRLKIEGDTEADIRPADGPSDCCSELLPQLRGKAQEEYSITNVITGASYEGWVTKQGGSVRTWKKRFCVLKNAALYYYKDDKTPQPQGFIKLADINKIEVHPTKPQWTMHTVFRAYPFIAKSVEERDKWVEKIQAARGTVQNQPSSPVMTPASPAPAAAPSDAPAADESTPPPTEL